MSARTTRTFLCLLQAAALCAALPTMVLAQGETPDSALALSLGQSATVSLGSGGSAVWFRVTYGSPTTESDFSITTEGQVDTCLDLYYDLVQARDGEPFVSDDDSGSGTNARLLQAIGFPSPLYLRLSRCGGSTSGSVRVVTRRQRIAPVRCPYPSSCIFATALEDSPSSTDYLADLAQLAQRLLRTRTGRQVATLYWQVSSELVVRTAGDAELRSEIRSHIDFFEPYLRAVATPSGEEVLISQELIERTQELLAAVRPLLFSTTATRLDRAVTILALEDHLGRPLRERLAQLGLDLEPGELRDEAPASRVIVKLAPHQAWAPTIVGKRLQLGNPGVDAVLSQYPVRSIRRVFRAPAPGANLASVFALVVDEPGSAPSLVSALRSQSEVEYAEMSGYLYALGDVFFANQYALRPSSASRGGINAIGAWQTTTGNAATRVAVVDTGVNYRLADLAGRIRTELGYDFADDDADPDDDHGHGTHVAGSIAAALNNGFSIAGVAPGVSIVPIRVLGANGSGTAESIAAGIEHAALAGAKVINLSLGGSDSFEVIEDALRFAAEHDVLIVAAAGNEGKPGLLYPARSKYCLAVSAVNSAGKRASFSSYGKGLALAAPGVDIVSIFRNGSSCLSSGTSMATPHVVGVAALVRSKNPSLLRAAVRQILIETARDVGRPGWDAEYGWGIVDAAKAVQR